MALLEVSGRWQVGSGFVRTASTLAMPAKYQLEGEATAADDALVRFELDVETTPNGPAVRRLVVTPEVGAALRTKDVRAVPLREILAEAGNAVALQVKESDTSIEYAPISDDRYRLIKKTLGRVKKGPVALTDEFLTQIADIYKHAVAEHQPPVVAVREATGQNHYTARNWVVQARKRGLLPPTSPGKVKA